jgi:AcrR family transcriptional regulator
MSAKGAKKQTKTQPWMKKQGLPRVRRTAEDARRLILQAAEKRLIAGGPEAIRLQDIAADVGLSHPAILHHFGSREGLMEALGDHAGYRLQEDLIRILATRRAGDPLETRLERLVQMLEVGHEMMAKRGYARLLAGLILSRRDLHNMKDLFRDFARTLHEVRVQRRHEDGHPAPSLEDTLFSITLVSVTLFGDALWGSHTRSMVGMDDDEETEQQFLRWLANLLEGYRFDVTFEQQKDERP